MSLLNGKTLNDRKILIVGFGSIGKKHFQACIDLGCKTFIISRSKSYHGDLNPNFINKEEVFNNIFDLVILCNNTDEHLKDLFYYYKFGKNFLVEKPLHFLKFKKSDIERLKRMNNVYVGYNLRHLKITNFLKEMFLDKKIKAIYSQFWDNCIEWYNGIAIKDSYVLDKKKGGGAFFTNFHEIDYIKYILSTELKSCFWLPYFSDNKDLSADIYSSVSGILNNKTIYSSSLWLLSSKRLRIGHAIIEHDHISWDIDKGKVWNNSNKLLFNTQPNYEKSYQLQIIDILSEEKSISSTLKSNINDINIIFK